MNCDLFILVYFSPFLVCVSVCVLLPGINIHSLLSGLLVCDVLTSLCLQVENFTCYSLFRKIPSFSHLTSLILLYQNAHLPC